MSPHPKPKSNSGRSHFSEAQHDEACAFFSSAFKNKRGRSPSIADISGPTALSKKGRSGDPVWREAFEGFLLAQRKEHRLITNKKQYRNVVRAWVKRFGERAFMGRIGAGRACALSAAEVQLAARVLGSPIVEADSCRYFETIPDCIASSEHGHRLQDLVDRKGISPLSLHRLLVHKLKVLTFNKCDVRDELPESTLHQRRKCADVWAGRATWLENPSVTRGGPPMKVYFKWKYYFEFTFMIDAISFEDGVHSGGHNQRVYKLVDTTFAPQLACKKKSIATSSKMMFYVLIHRHGGIVGGPWLMYSGSRVSHTQAAHKGAILAPWCGPTQHPT